MKKSKEYRINGFEQIKTFYSWVFNNQDKRITPQHVSLYLFYINQNNRNNWVEWFKCPYDLGMAGSCIGNKKTYYSCLTDLMNWGLIGYKKGINEWQSPLIKLEVLKCTTTYTATVPLPIPPPQPLPTPQSRPLPTHIYKLITNNLKPITDNYDKFEKFVLSLGVPSNPSVKKADILDLIINEWQEEYHSQREMEYTITSRAKERAAAVAILKEFKKQFPHDDTKNILNRIRDYFSLCIGINESWFWTNMSLPIIMSKYNEINTVLKNGNNKSNNKQGATPEQIKQLYARKHGIDSPSYQ
jgi:hypothetical protein